MVRILGAVAIPLAACAPPQRALDSDSVPVTTAETDTAADSDEVDPRPRFVEPAPAIDLDPAPGVVHVSLIAGPHARTVDGLPIDGVAYNAQVPGPTLRANVGDTVIVDLENTLDEPTTVHWHGIAVPWEMDGITWVQDPVEPGETSTYTFTVRTAGTFWYHPHFDGSRRQVDLGMYGALIVADPSDPAVDAEVIVVLDADGDGDGDGHFGALPGPWTVNGLVTPEFSPPSGSTVRARIVNASDVGYVDLRWPDPRHVGGDQGLLAALDEPDGGLVLAPGDRADLEWRIGDAPWTLSSAPWSIAGGATLGDPVPLLEVAPTGAESPPAPIDWPFSHDAPSPDPASTDIVWVLQGDGDAWFINGERYPDVTVPVVTLGEVAIVEVRNLSATEHPFHLHGHAFEVLSIDGVPSDRKRIEDTINVPIRSIVRLRVLADNPGDWMAHCHILPHAHDGMMTVLRVQP